MNDAAALDRLAALAGIRSSYWDIFGVFHEATPEAKRKLLAAMGYPAETAAQIAESHRMLDEGPWSRMVEPAVVIRRPDLPAVNVTLPSIHRGRRMRWELRLEAGQTLVGEVLPQSLDLIDVRQLDGAWMERRRLELPADIPEGYHEVIVENGDGQGRSRLIVAPESSWQPAEFLRGVRRFGFNCHLYSLRSRGDWGIGDFTGLRRLGEFASQVGAATVGVNPLHALYPDRPEHASPYSPSSRLFLNPLYIDVAAVPGFAACPKAKAYMGESGLAARLEAARSAGMVDYTAVAALKSGVLECLFSGLASLPGGEREAFAAFRRDGGDVLERFCRHQALREHFQGRPWHQWPQEFQRPDNREVASFAASHAERVAFHAWLQWQADRQLAHAVDVNVGIGLYRDLAVGADPDGADAWSDPEMIVRGARFGAPPDAFNPLGQDWGLPPPHPMLLKERGYEPFVRLFRANMRHAGALRIDHVMSLKHLYWLNPGDKASDGAYVAYPFDDLLGVLALESRRNRCMVVGEDLGTVPDGFRARMEKEGVLSYRLFYFERWESGLFKRPEAYPSQALATATTHDLPTIAGHWRGADIHLRERLELFTSEEAHRADARSRQLDRELLVAALRDQGLEPEGLLLHGDGDRETMKALTLAVETFLARSSARLLMLNLDDLLIEDDQLNLPGTVDEYPNWRRRLSLSVEELSLDPFVRQVLKAVAREREN